MKFIELEGLDGCGKTTQINEICKRLEENNQDFKKIKLPDYENDSSILVRKYLNGDFGKTANDVNAYAASLFYTVDRIASYSESWKEDYLNDRLIIADRYTSANLIYQMAKLPKIEWAKYLHWLTNLEFNMVELPKPNEVIFLDMPVEISQKLMSERYNGDESKKDIHEKNVEYLKLCREAALYAAEHLDWKIVSCVTDTGEIRTIEDINEEIMKYIFAYC